MPYVARNDLPKAPPSSISSMNKPNLNLDILKLNRCHLADLFRAAIRDQDSKAFLKPCGAIGNEMMAPELLLNLINS